MLRCEKDVLRDGSVKPDIVVVEFAVNDEGDETKQPADAVRHYRMSQIRGVIAIIKELILAEDPSLTRFPVKLLHHCIPYTHHRQIICLSHRRQPFLP